MNKRPLDIKRIMDFTLSALALVALSPLLLVVSLAIFFTMGWPVFFVQWRPGFMGRPFKLHKFRTMVNTLPGIEQANVSENSNDDQRLTRLGRFLRSASIDELPELFNVIRGEMSLVGPRPLLMEYLPRYTREQMRRHDVLPGMSGWAQTNGRNALTWEQKFELDLWYVRNRSLFLDIKIIAMTIWQVIHRKDISAAGHVTMPKFNTEVNVIGAGGHAKVVISTLRAAGYRVGMVYDDDPSKWGTEIMGVQVIGPIARLSEKKDATAILAIGDNGTRKTVLEKVRAKWVSVIHPEAYVEPTAKIGEGVVVFAKATIQPQARIGDHAIVNTGAVIDHDCVVGAFAHIAPGANLAGAVSVGEGSLVGIGTSVIPCKKIGAWTQVGAASCVITDIPGECVAYGVPARVVRRTIHASGKPISMSSPDIEDSDVQAVVQVVRSGCLSLGPKHREFEKAFTDYIGCKHAVAVSSGTAGLHLIVKSLGIKPGDEVLVPSFTFAASVNAILFEGATPVFVDIEPEIYTLDIADAERKVTTKTKALLVVDTFGHPADWAGIEKLAAKYSLKVIDDSCEALGAVVGGRKIGKYGDAAAFAFYPNKQITTGEGGMIVTDNDEIARLCRSYRNQGRPEMGQWLEHERLGYNYRMDEMSAALGVSQMKRVESFLRKREQVAAAYTDRLRNLDWVSAPKVQPGVRMSWFVYVVTLESGFPRDELMKELVARGIPSRAYFSPIHKQAYMRPLLRGEGPSLPVTDDIEKRTLALPFHNNMDAREIARVVETLATAGEKLRSREALALVPKAA